MTIVAIIIIIVIIIIIISLYCPTLGKFIMSPQEKRHGVMALIQTSDLTVERPMLYHLSYPARHASCPSTTSRDWRRQKQKL
jgi:hypothetical protein